MNTQINETFQNYTMKGSSKTTDKQTRVLQHATVRYPANMLVYCIMPPLSYLVQRFKGIENYLRRNSAFIVPTSPFYCWQYKLYRGSLLYKQFRQWLALVRSYSRQVLCVVYWHDYTTLLHTLGTFYRPRVNTVDAVETYFQCVCWPLLEVEEFEMGILRTWTWVPYKH